MDWLARAVGAVTILYVLRDIFHTLGHPEGHGTLSRFVLSTIWRLSTFRGKRGRLARLAGPVALITVIMVWGTLAILGWALVYLPSVPTGFVYASGSETDVTNVVLDALYISMSTISTLGFGDVVPAPGWLRVVTPLEALFGFALLTVAVSWVLQVYPALARRRVLAIRLSSLRRTMSTTALRDAEATLIAAVLERLSTDIIQARIDLSEYSETYYFRDEDPNCSLAAMLPYAAELASIGAAAPRSDTRFAAKLLMFALEGFTEVLKDRFPHTAPIMSDLLAAYAADHGHDPVSGQANE
ncbi:potassium channel family protein [Microbacterium profundi]|uniref:potassium channel family protein n=1 Tax=Microbacterium profundi TaxID=450380 RepID=UPI00051A3907|nr:potassium channel family protein [Microbacterium profundi]